MYLDPDSIPFYIGKGKKNRYKVSEHMNKSSSNNFLKNKIRKVGTNNIKIQFLHKNISEEESFQFEIFYIELYGRRDLGTGALCNLTNGGEGNSGYIMSDETKQKLSDLNKGKVLSTETKQKISKARKDIPLSDETKQKLSDLNRGRIVSDETRQKLVAASKGHIVSDETRQKMRDTQKGRTHSDETKRKISKGMNGKNLGKPAWNKGKKIGPPSDKTKQKISKGMKQFKKARCKQEKLNK